MVWEELRALPADLHPSLMSASSVPFFYTHAVILCPARPSGFLLEHSGFPCPTPLLEPCFVHRSRACYKIGRYPLDGTGRWECHLTLGWHWYSFLFLVCYHYIWDILYVFSVTFWCFDFMSLTCTSMNAKLLWKTIDNTKLGGYHFPFRICLLVVWPLGLPVLASTMTSEENSPLLCLFFLRLEGVPLILTHM